jgi:hypothetical protein
MMEVYYTRPVHERAGALACWSKVGMQSARRRPLLVAAAAGAAPNR